VATISPSAREFESGPCRFRAVPHDRRFHCRGIERDRLPCAYCYTITYMLGCAHKQMWERCDVAAHHAGSAGTGRIGKWPGDRGGGRSHADRGRGPRGADAEALRIRAGLRALSDIARTTTRQGDRHVRHGRPLPAPGRSRRASHGGATVRCAGRNRQSRDHQQPDDRRRRGRDRQADRALSGRAAGRPAVQRRSRPRRGRAAAAGRPDRRLSQHGDCRELV